MLSKLNVMTVLRQSLLIAEDWEYVPQRRFCRTPNPSQSKTSVSRLWNTHWSRHTAGTTTARGGSLPVALKDVWTYTLTGCSLDRCSHDRWSAKLESLNSPVAQEHHHACGHHRQDVEPSCWCWSPAVWHHIKHKTTWMSKPLATCCTNCGTFCAAVQQSWPWKIWFFCSHRWGQTPNKQRQQQADCDSSFMEQTSRWLCRRQHQNKAHHLGY